MWELVGQECAAELEQHSDADAEVGWRAADGAAVNALEGVGNLAAGRLSERLLFKFQQATLSELGLCALT